jgi:hypothetical protein
MAGGFTISKAARSDAIRIPRPKRLTALYAVFVVPEQIERKRMIEFDTLHEL